MLSPFAKNSTTSAFALCNKDRRIFYSIKRRARQRDFLNIDSYCSLCSRTRSCRCSSGACFTVFCDFRKNQRIYQEKLFVWPSGKLLKHREYCFTLLEDSRGEIFGEWIIDLDGLCIWRWYEVHSRYLQNSFVYLSSRHVAGFWRLVLYSSWIASCFQNHCSHAQTVYRHIT